MCSCTYRKYYLKCSLRDKIKLLSERVHVCHSESCLLQYCYCAARFTFLLTSACLFTYLSAAIMHQMDYYKATRPYRHKMSRKRGMKNTQTCAVTGQNISMRNVD